MKQRRSALRTVLLYGMSLLIFAAYPLPVPHVYAEDATPTTTAPTTDTTTAPAPTTTSIPPAEKPAEPVKPTYTYDSTTGHWNTDQWQYSSDTGTYQPVVVAPLPAAPEPAATTTPSTPTPTDTSTPTATRTPTRSWKARPTERPSASPLHRPTSTARP